MKTKIETMNSEIAALAKLADADIDVSDISEIADWSRAETGIFFHGEDISGQKKIISEGDATAIPDALLEFIGMTHEDLLEHCIRGTDKAWLEFERRFQPLIVHTVAILAKRWGDFSQDLIEDLAQEVFMKLRSNENAILRSFRSTHELSFYKFLKTVAATSVSDHFRSTQLQQTKDNDDLVAAAQDPNKIHAALRGFASAKESVIFWLYYGKGLSAAQIASLPDMNLTVKGVESVVWRLTNAVRSALEIRDESGILPTTNKFLNS
jgi:RNA polymerase sigma-70 factor (ECF subfamily)